MAHHHPTSAYWKVRSLILIVNIRPGSALSTSDFSWPENSYVDKNARTESKDYLLSFQETKKLWIIVDNFWRECVCAF